jgi:enterochelin esterase-like enzyme
LIARRAIALAVLGGVAGCGTGAPDCLSSKDLALPFPEVVQALTSIADSSARDTCAASLAQWLTDSNAAFKTDSSAILWYHGPAAQVFVAGDLNGWSPTATPLVRIPQTRLFWREIPLPAAARLEYKLVVDGRWILDPANPSTVQGGFGENSELRMPAYRPPEPLTGGHGAPAGRLDTLRFVSRLLHRTVQIYVYVPAASADHRTPLPSLTVGDGGGYLWFTPMRLLLDHLIAQDRIPPLIGIFLESRSDNPSVDLRRSDYWMNQRFADFVAGELRDTLRHRYPISRNPEQTAIMGASLGGVLATYVTLKHPTVFGMFAAQSPAYWVSNDSIFSIVQESSLLPRKAYLDSGTMHDAQQEASRMRDTLTSRGCLMRYVEVPEGHNWANWGARLDTLLPFLFGDTP